MSTSDRPIPDDIEPVQAVLVARLDGPAARLQAKRAVFAVFFAWTPGGSLRERVQRGHALITRRDLAEAERQQSRLTLLVNIALAVGGPPPSALRPSRGAERDGDPLVALFFRTSPGPASLVARRHAARDILATLHGRAYEQALRLHHRSAHSRTRGAEATTMRPSSGLARRRPFQAEAHVCRFPVLTDADAPGRCSSEAPLGSAPGIATP
jgi:hypothetical protein